MRFYDRFKIHDSVSYTDEGYVVVDANLTRVGIFDYPEYNLRMYRPEEEVFSDDSLRTLRGKSVTIAHPSERVTPDNWKKLEVGQVLDAYPDYSSDKFIYGKLILKDKKAIKIVNDAIKNGDSIELSCGYDAEVEETKGKADEGEYDSIQRNIRYNHVAIVAKGRAGSKVKILLDSINNEGVNKMRIKLLDTFVEVDEKDVRVFEDAEKQFNDIKKKLADAEVAKAAAEKKLQDAEKELEEAKKKTLSDADVEKLAEELAEVKGFCDGLKLEVEGGIKEMKTALIDHFLPSMNIKEKDDAVYFDAAWTATKELAKKSVKTELKDEGASGEYVETAEFEEE